MGEWGAGPMRKGVMRVIRAGLSAIGCRLVAERWIGTQSFPELE